MTWRSDGKYSVPVYRSQLPQRSSRTLQHRLARLAQRKAELQSLQRQTVRSLLSEAEAVLHCLQSSLQETRFPSSTRELIH